jgi:fumarate hydratase subunit alpha
MREIECKKISETVSSLFQQGCLYLTEDVLAAIKKARDQEESPVAKDVLGKLI